jgi:sugar fermentation stimulation protein A
MYSKYKKATFLKRINRFVSKVSLEGREIDVYVPNTGRLSELAIPEYDVLLKNSDGKYSYRIEYIFYKNFPIMINSSHSNSLFKDLILKGDIPHLKNSTYIRSEPSYKNHRFDFLMKDTKNNNFFIELKSCTLAYKNVAAFPDAISERASRHITNLAETENNLLIFFILHRDIKIFIPNYHTDFKFYETLKKYSNKINLLALSIDYDKNLEINKIKKVKIHLPEVKPSGFAIIIFQTDEITHLSTDEKKIELKKGFYLSIEHDEENIFKRVETIKSKRKNKNHFIDRINSKIKIIRDIPIVTEENILGKIQKDINSITDEKIPMSPEKNIYYFKNNPVEKEELWQIAFKYRYNIYS